MAPPTQAERRPVNARTFHLKRYRAAKTPAGKYLVLTGWLWALAKKTGRRQEALKELEQLVNDFGNGREIP